MKSNKSQKDSTLTVLVEDYWGRLSPIHQTTANAGTLLGNAFESLVDLNPQGGIVPGLARRWYVSDDDRLFRFYLRPNIRFSDGTPLTPALYIKSLLESVVATDRESHNPNALNILNRLKGFSIGAAERKDVAGLRVEDDNSIVFEFTSPFRTALFELSDTRYAAWKTSQMAGEFLGTGPYQIVRHIENERIDYEPNPFAWRKAIHPRVVALAAPGGYLDLCRKKGQVYLGRSLPQWLKSSECKNTSIDFQGGAISGHSLIAVNGRPGKIFEKANLRLAIQFAVHKVARSVLPQTLDTRTALLDSQFFPPLWPGRLEEDEVEKMILRGEEYLPELVQATRLNPIQLLCADESYKNIQIGLEKMGVRFARPFRVEEVRAVIEAMQGKHEYDLNVHGAMTIGNDPDDLYHLLGKSGALGSPATFRPQVGLLMERARRAVHGEDLHPFYSNVSRAILEEVPEIHIAFRRGGTFFDSTAVKRNSLGSNNDRFRFDEVLNYNL